VAVQREPLVKILQVHLHGQPHLAHVAEALRLPRLLARLRKHREQNRRQYRDNRNHDQQFNQCKAVASHRDHLLFWSAEAELPPNR
jgi:hypothetical protein